MAGSSAAEMAQNQKALLQAQMTMARVLAAVQDPTALAQAGDIVVNNLKEMLSSPGPSLPGEPPAMVTGTLRDSYVSHVVNDGVEISSSVEYAAYLEFGTHKMAPRPHLRPAINQSLGQISASVADAVVAREIAAIGGARAPGTIGGGKITAQFAGRARGVTPSAPLPGSIGGVRK